MKILEGLHGRLFLNDFPAMKVMEYRGMGSGIT
jgi:hypothetical protein